MSSILGLSSTQGNTAHQKKKSESGTVAHSVEAAHQKRTWGASSCSSSSSSAWTKRMPWSTAPPSPSCRRGAAPTTGPSSRAPGPPSPVPPSSSSPSPPSLSSRPQQHVGRGRTPLCRQRRRHQRAPAQQGEELLLRSAARCGRSSAAPGQRDCRAAPPEVVSSVPVGRRAHLAPPPPRQWQASDLFSARVIATVIRSCRSHERSRRCRLRAAAIAVSTPTLVDIIKAQIKSHQHKTRATCLSLVRCVWCRAVVTSVQCHIVCVCVCLGALCGLVCYILYRRAKSRHEPYINFSGTSLRVCEKQVYVNGNRPRTNTFWLQGTTQKVSVTPEKVYVTPCSFFHSHLWIQKMDRGSTTC